MLFYNSSFDIFFSIFIAFVPPIVYLILIMGNKILYATRLSYAQSSEIRLAYFQTLLIITFLLLIIITGT